MNPSKVVISVTLAALALFLPVRGLAELLAGATSPLLPQVITGVWAFKVMLAVHAALVFGLARVEAPRPSAEPLVSLSDSGRPAGWEWMALAALLAIGAFLRLYQLGIGLWFDEIQTLVSYTRLPIGQILTTFDSQNQHKLYSVLAHTTTSMFGESGWTLRLPAALLGVASLGALYWFARMVVSNREALLATALLTFSYHHVWFSQNARGYTGLLLWTLIGSGLLLRLLAADEKRGWGIAAAYGLVMALGVYTHVTALFVLAAHGLIWLALLLRSRAARSGSNLWLPLAGFVFAGTFTLQLYALVLPQFLATLTEPTMEGIATEWKDPFWLFTETLRVLAEGIPGGMATVTIGLAVVLAGVISFVKRSWVLGAVLVLPGLIMAGVLLSMEHNLWPRFFFFSAGFAVLIAIRGGMAAAALVMRSRGPAIATATLVLATVGSAATVPTAWHPKQDYVGARDFVEKAKAAGDAVVTIDMSRYAYQSYVAPGFLGVTTAEELARIERAHARTWILYTFPTRLAAIQPELWKRLQTEYRPAAEFWGTVGGGNIVVKVKP